MLESIAIVVAAIITAGLPFYSKWKFEQRKNTILNIKINKLLSENKDLIKEQKDLISHEIIGDLNFFNGIKDIVEHLFEKTKIDRFLILTGHNGSQDLTFATAVYEHHKMNDKILLSIGATKKYKGFKFDQTYKNMIKTSEKYGYIDYNVAEMEECDLKNIYEEEGIYHSRILFLLRTTVDDKNDVVFFASLATHDKAGFTKKERIILKMQGDQLIGLFSKIEKERLVNIKIVDNEMDNLKKIEKNLNNKK